ncbi:unnamed protein product [Trichobilharzia szidati]|nr:unnamed protein product [Trichobilharzia szidati]
MSNRIAENASEMHRKKRVSSRNDREKLCWWLGKSPKQIRKRLKAGLGKKSTRTSSTVASSLPTQISPGYLSAYEFAEVIGEKDFFAENLLFDCRWESSSSSLLHTHSILNAIRVNHLYNVHVPTTYWESLLKSRINFSRQQPPSEKQILIILIVDKTNSPWKTRIQQTLQHLVNKLTEENASESLHESSSKPGTLGYFKYFEILISEITNDLPWLLNPKMYSNGQNILELRPPLSTLNNRLWYLEPHSWIHLSEFSPSYITSLINNKSIDCILVITYNLQKDLCRVASLKLRIPYLLVDTASILNECKVLSKFEQILNFLNNPIEYIRQGSNFKTFSPFSEAFCSADNQTCANNILITGSNAPACLTILAGLVMITCPCQLNAAIEQFSSYHDYSSQLTEEYLKILTLLNNYLLNSAQKSNKKDLGRLKHCRLSSRMHEGRISSNRPVLNPEDHQSDSKEGKGLAEEEKVDNQQQDNVIPFRLPSPDVISEEMMHQLEQFKIRA